MSAATSGGSATSEQAPDVPGYSMLIEWSDEDGVYLVRLPEWEAAGAVLDAVTHGQTYEEAARNGVEALESLIASWQDMGWPLPALRGAQPAGC